MSELFAVFLSKQPRYVPVFTKLFTLIEKRNCEQFGALFSKSKELPLSGQIYVTPNLISTNYLIP